MAGLAEELSALGFDQLIINDPKDADYLEQESWGFTGSQVDREFIEEIRRKAYIILYLGAEEEVPEALLGIMKVHDCRQSIVDDEDWLHKWEEYYVPFNMTEDIVVKPVWRDYERKAGELVIEIDPGLAFGTGTSPTTYLAARYIEKYIRPYDKVIDVGCGTGILSVIASKLGARNVLALDIDPECISSTLGNSRLNECGNIEARTGDLLKGVDIQADLVAANLTAPLQLLMLPDLPKCLRPGGILVASGIIDEREEDIIAAFEAAGLEILEKNRAECWTALAARLN